MANYCSEEEAQAQLGRTDLQVQGWWLNAIDKMMERWTGQGYKGRTREKETTGDGNELLRLSSEPGSITSVTEADTLLPPSEYYVYNGRYLKRRDGLRWYAGVTYKIVYVEPNMDDDPEVLPDDWRLCAAECVATITTWVQKRKKFGSALTITESGDAGKVASSTSTSFPASLVEDLRRTIQNMLRRSSF